jgi:hypothetical protein
MSTIRELLGLPTVPKIKPSGMFGGPKRYKDRRKAYIKKIRVNKLNWNRKLID